MADGNASGTPQARQSVRALRARMEQAVEALIAAMDALDGDSDLEEEPDLEEGGDTELNGDEYDFMEGSPDDAPTWRAGRLVTYAEEPALPGTVWLNNDRAANASFIRGSRLWLRGELAPAEI